VSTFGAKSGLGVVASIGNNATYVDPFTNIGIEVDGDCSIGVNLFDVAGSSAGGT